MNRGGGGGGGGGGGPPNQNVSPYQARKHSVSEYNKKKYKQSNFHVGHFQEFPHLKGEYMRIIHGGMSRTLYTRYNSIIYFYKTKNVPVA